MKEQTKQENAGHEKDSNTRTMLEFCKFYLGRIKFDRRHQLREYEKSLQFLNAGDQVELKRWLDLNNKID